MYKASPRLEALFFAVFSAAALVAAIAAKYLRGLVDPHNARVAYGFAHLPITFLWISTFSLALSLALLISAAVRSPNPSTAFFVAAIAALYCVFWLPVWLAGGFVQDDWWLLAAASIRKVISTHPLWSWYTLDTVDGNFRPIGTVLYFGWLYPLFGPAARVFTFGPFAVTFLAATVAFAVVRELGYSRVVAAAASSLFLSRAMLYTVVAWTAALGDSLAIAFCGLCALFVLKASRTTGLRAGLWHATAWLCFVFAGLSKQSAFGASLIVALLLYLRPGDASPPQHRSRPAWTAALALAVYGATSCLLFLHARALLRGRSPYPLSFSFRTLLQPFAYVTSYFAVIQFPASFGRANLLSPLLGIVIVAVGLLLLRKTRAYAARPRDIVFTALAAVSSALLFAFLGTRLAAYYGCMAAFWLSILLAIVLAGGIPAEDAKPGWPPARFAFCLLLASGFAEIRLEQTGLFPSGGYIWGDYGMQKERAIEQRIEQQLAAAPADNTVLLSGCRLPDPYTSMVLLHAPAVQRILVYNQTPQTYAVNDREGMRPGDDLPSLSDPGAYHWDNQIAPEKAEAFLPNDAVLQLTCTLSDNSP